MTVQELIEKLSVMDPTLTVMTSCDTEGNGYYRLGYVEESPLDEDREPCHPDDADDEAGRVVVLWP